MKIAAQLKGREFKVFIEGTEWKELAKPFYKETMSFDLVVYYKEGQPIFHDTVSRSEPVTHPSLIFCRDYMTMASFEQHLMKAGYDEPYELRLGNDKFDLKKVFPRAYALTFHNYSDNAACLSWLRSLSYLQADLLLKGLLTQDRYFNATFSQYREFSTIEAFIDHRFEIWHEGTVKEFEEALLKDKAHCPSCDI